MAEEITSFDDYVSHLTKRLRLLRHFERCVFSAWCADHLLTTKAVLVETELSNSCACALREILDEIWVHLLSGSIPTTDVLNELDSQLMQIGPDDPVAAIEVHPIATEVQSAIGICILGCRRNDVELTQKVGEAIINVLDYELDEQDSDYAANSLATMFSYPAMKNEVDAQLAMIQHLRGQYTLDERIRAVFRA